MPFTPVETSVFVALRAFCALGRDFAPHDNAFYFARDDDADLRNAAMKHHKRDGQFAPLQETVTDICADHRQPDKYIPLVYTFSMGLQQVLLGTPLTGTQIIHDILRRDEKSISLATIRARQIDFIEQTRHALRHAGTAVSDMAAFETLRAANNVLNHTSRHNYSEMRAFLHEGRAVDAIKKPPHIYYFG